MPGRLHKFFPRFSLRTLPLFLLFVTSATALWFHWQPWYLQSVLEGHDAL